MAIMDQAAAAAAAARPFASSSPCDTDFTINLDHGDPKMFEAFWEKIGTSKVEITGEQSMSYFSSPADNKLCWFLETELGEAIRQLHGFVGNAVTEDRHLVVGTGSTQLLQAALYALCPPHQSHPVSVVSAAPFYSGYPTMADFLQSTLYQWKGDARSFKSEGRPFIEMVTSPSNPDGFTREAVVNTSEGKLIHDLAYYWPQYTPITHPLDHDLMLFTFSKCSGHAGSRIGWALVKDEEVAKKMVKFVELTTIGVSRDSQLRAAKIMQVILQSYSDKKENFFEYGKRVMTERWDNIRMAVERGSRFCLPKYPKQYCRFFGEFVEPHPAFAWLCCNKEGEVICSDILREYKILTRNGKSFGVDAKYARISMVDRDKSFKLFVERLSQLSQGPIKNYLERSN